MAVTIGVPSWRLLAATLNTRELLNSAPLHTWNYLYKVGGDLSATVRSMTEAPSKTCREAQRRRATRGGVGA